MGPFSLTGPRVRQPSLPFDHRAYHEWSIWSRPSLGVVVPWVRSSVVSVLSVLFCVSLVVGAGHFGSRWLSPSGTSLSASGLPREPLPSLPGETSTDDPSDRPSPEPSEVDPPGESEPAEPTETVTLAPSDLPTTTETATVTASPEPAATVTETVTAAPESTGPDCSRSEPCAVVLGDDPRLNDWLLGIALGVGVLALLVSLHVVASWRRRA